MGRHAPPLSAIQREDRATYVPGDRPVSIVSASTRQGKNDAQLHGADDLGGRILQGRVEGCGRIPMKKGKVYGK